MTRPRAIVLGASGQDGTLVVKRLARSGWDVVATGRSLDTILPPSWEIAGVPDTVRRVKLDPLDEDALAQLIDAVRPSALFCLSAQSSVGRSFAEPEATLKSNLYPVLSSLEAVRKLVPECHILVASSGEIFGETSAVLPATEASVFRPASPYANAKAMVVMAARAYRDAYGLRVSIAHLFGHESPLRDERFVFGKALAAVKAIRAGEATTVGFGSLTVVRDWGWADDYAAAMIRMAEDFRGHELILATGNSLSLEHALRMIFSAAGLDFDEHVRVDPSARRPSDIAMMHADVSAARAAIGWDGSIPFPALADRLLAGEVA
jgi:GDPmannose 4,6-dehydratase